MTGLASLRPGSHTNGLISVQSRALPGTTATTSFLNSSADSSNIGPTMTTTSVATSSRSQSSIAPQTSRSSPRTSSRTPIVRLGPSDLIDDNFWSSLIGSLFGLHPLPSSHTSIPSTSHASANSAAQNQIARAAFTLPDRQRPRSDWTEVGEWWMLDNVGSPSASSSSSSGVSAHSLHKMNGSSSQCTLQTFSDGRPLPAGWERRIDPTTQRIYYVNHINRITQWEDPRERGMDENQPLPRGWEKRYTPQGQRFFIDHNTRTTTFIDPRTGQHAGSLGTMGVPLQYERNFRAKLEYFRACCAHAMVVGQTKILVSRDNLLEDSFQLISQMTPTSLRRRLSITFLHEEGLDYGGVAREWFYGLSREIFNPMFGLFEYTGKNYGLQINPASHVNPNHLSYFHFVGRLIGMALFHGRCLDGGLTLSFYKRILGRKLTLEDLGHTDHDYYQSLAFIRDTNIDRCDLDIYFVGSYDLLGEVHEDELIDNGRNVKVTEDNKHEYIRLMVDWRFTRGVAKQTEALHKGIHDVLEPQWLQLFDERELELLLSGMPEIDVADWEKNTTYLKYTRSSKQITWFWKQVGYKDEQSYCWLTISVYNTDPRNHLAKLTLSSHSKENDDYVIVSVAFEAEVQRILVDSVIELPVTSDTIRADTAQEEILLKVIGFVQSSWSNVKISTDLRLLFSRRGYPLVVDNCLMFGDPVVVSMKLRKRILQQFHSGHPGTSRMKALARSLVYWPQIVSEIKQFCHSCQFCQQAAKAPPKCPWQPWCESEKSWQRVRLDYAGLINGQFYLISVDSFTKWPDLIPMQNPTPQHTINELNKLFQYFGTPDMLVTDNGTQFTPTLFRKFCMQNGIRRTTHNQMGRSNGLLIPLNVLFSKRKERGCHERQFSRF
ncbi:unnamed protein product [Dicrocoelium dendriticum]|nr:unnamed protein product [Dicrocoelium dendriticum]